MDIRIEADDGREWLELRDARPVDDAGFSGFVRTCVDQCIYKRPFWFGRGELQEFLHQAEWLYRSATGHATLGHAGRPDQFTFFRTADGWSVSGELFDFSDAEAHLRFRFTVSDAAARAFVNDLELLRDQRSYAG